MLAYLARYTHRTAMANSRLVAVGDDDVAFSYKDYRRGGRSRVMRLAPNEFIRRFLLHVLPDGFHRIRHYGFLARGERALNLERVCALLSASSDDDPAEPVDPRPPLDAATRSQSRAAAGRAALGVRRRTAGQHLFRKP